MTVDEGCTFFSAVPAIRDKLLMLQKVGLGYIRIGQQATTLSGGEAQRVKLSKELSRRSTGKTVYILDEPTTGLHFEDVRNLLAVLHALVGPGQHGDRDRAQPGDRQDGGLDHRSRPGGRRQGRAHRRRRHAGGCRPGRGELYRTVSDPGSRRRRRAAGGPGTRPGLTAAHSPNFERRNDRAARPCDQPGGDPLRPAGELRAGERAALPAADQVGRGAGRNHAPDAGGGAAGRGCVGLRLRLADVGTPPSTMSRRAPAGCTAITGASSSGPGWAAAARTGRG